MAIKSFKRWEKKFLLSKEQYEKLLPRLLAYMNQDEYCSLGKNYNIYNIYFDTKDNDVVRHSTAKPYYKEKLRLRSYVVPKNPSDTVFLELKKKIGGVVNKRRVVMTLEECNKFLSLGVRPEREDFITNQVLNEIEYYLSRNTVIPSVYISYSRKAFFGKDNKDFRITFDSNILTRRTELYLEKGSFGKELLEKNQYLMEVKILGSMPLWLAHAFSELKIYSTSFSKYGNEFEKYSFNATNINKVRRENIC